MSEDLLKFILDTAQKLGAEYAEARLHMTRGTGCMLRNGVLEPPVLQDASGVGIRIVHSGSLSFAATNNLSSENIKKMVENAIKRAKASSSISKQKIRVSNEKTIISNWAADERKSLENVGFDDLLYSLKDFDSIVKDGKGDVAFSNRLLVLATSLEEKVFANSDGTMLKSRVPRVSFHGFITASYKGELFTVTIPPGYSQFSESGGWEVLERLNLYERIPKEAESLVISIKSEKKPPSEKVDLILGPQVTGIIAHESAGHPGEADRILGREAAQAGESYLKPYDLDLRVGSSEAYVSDDPTISHSNGFYLFDDEGVSAKKRKLIEGGIIREFLHNRFTAYDFNLTSNGASRAASYDREPIVRMANTFVEPGDYSFEELLDNIDLGIYIKSFMEWNIDDKRLNQRYVGLEAYLIEKGELKGTIRSPILEITTPKLWSSIDARDKEIEFVGATCGKGDPMQDIPVWTGGPNIRLRGIRVGGR